MYVIKSIHTLKSFGIPSSSDSVYQLTTGAENRRNISHESMWTTGITIIRLPKNENNAFWSFVDSTVCLTFFLISSSDFLIPLLNLSARSRQV